MKETLEELVLAIAKTTIVSKLNGKKNWMIHTEIDNEIPRIRFAGRAGQGEVFQTCFISQIAKYHYRWYYFTYKKDYDEALRTLLALGYKASL